MGADLYIPQIHEPLRKRCGPLFEQAVRLRDDLQQRLQRLSKSDPDRRQTAALAAAAQELADHFFDAMYGDGHFRDPYNPLGLLWRLNLSWWQDIKPLLDKERLLQGNDLHWFRAQVAHATLKLPTLEELKKAGATLDDKENSLAAWHQHYRDQHRALIAFLDRAIALQAPVRCSV